MTMCPKINRDGAHELVQFRFRQAPTHRRLLVRYLGHAAKPTAALTMAVGRIYWVTRAAIGETADSRPYRVHRAQLSGVGH
jgi:hypothetical protein